MTTESVKSIHHTQLELLRSMDLPFEVDQYSTLNESFNVGEITPVTTTYPTIKYMAIGRGGHKHVTSAGGDSLVDILKHSPTDAVLFEHIPFVLVPTNADLTPVERAKYRIRVLRTYGGVDYFAYYLRVIDTAAIAPTARVIELSNSEIISDVPYVPGVSSLSPTPVDLSNTVVNTVEGKHLLVQSVLTVVLDSTDVTRLLDAIDIIFGDIRYATISEVGIVSAVDAEHTTTLGGVNVTYTEADVAQIFNFISTELPLQHSPSSATLKYGLSNAMPLPPTAIT